MEVENLVYWINERERIRQKKEAGLPRPWSDDPVFNSVYFCNVRRENDKVTKWIRDFYSPYVEHPMFEYNIILSRFVNWPATLNLIGFMEEHNREYLFDCFAQAEKEQSKVWGGAYIITTHGLPMGKAQYLIDRVLNGAWQALGATPTRGRYPTSGPLLAARHGQLMCLEGLGSFLAAQAIADLKNTYEHPLQEAPDWWTWCAPGPGSLRGIKWALGRSVIPTRFLYEASILHDSMEYDIPRICMQDFQNCLCEFDKYMRVKTNSGRSKRGYPCR